MALITNKELINELYKPGKVEMPILAQHDVFKVLINKHDLISQLKGLEPDDPAPWCVVRVEEDMVPSYTLRSLDVQDDRD